MRKVHVLLPTSLAEKVYELAATEGRSTASVIREGLSDWMRRRDQEERFDQALNAVGAFSSGLGDSAERHDVYIAAGDLVSVAEIARRAARPVSTIQTWRRRYESFPRPLTTLGAGPVWDWDEVERWTRRHSAGETRRRRPTSATPIPLDLPGADLVTTGLDDIAAGRLSIEAALVSMATHRLSDLGIRLPGAPMDDASNRLYELVEKQVGEQAAHGRYNALRRRLLSFMRTLAVARA